MTIEQFVNVAREFDEELRNRDPAAFRAAQRDGGTLKLLQTHADLTQRFSAKLAAWRPPSVNVKPGDWVTISGTRFRIGAVDVETGTVSIQRVRVDGRVVSSETGLSAEGLVADANAPDEDELESMAPMSARERLTAQATKVALHEAAKVPAAQDDGVTALNEVQLRRFWAFLHETRAARRTQLAAPGSSADGYSRWVNERHRQIAVLGELIALLHRLVGDAPACGLECVHLSSGLTVAQHQHVRAALKAILEATTYESEENYTAEYCSAALARFATD